MDSNELSVEGYPLTQLPLGFGMALALNDMAMNSYAELTETEREHLLMRCKDARSKEEMQKIVNSVLPDGSAEALMADTEEASRMNRSTDRDKLI